MPVLLSIQHLNWREEFPELDISMRGAVSIARRVQDLAELVKIEPKSIGVGQYQHDVNQRSSAAPLMQWWKAVLTSSESN